MNKSITVRSDKAIIIIGGGVSGTLTAFHLRRLDKDIRIVLIDPRPEIGLGLAYSTPSLRHLLNVSADKMSALPDRPLHFLHWLRSHFDQQANETTFAPRAVFGRYIQSIVNETPNIEFICGTVIDCQLSEMTAEVTLDDGRRLLADRVVLAIGNFEPAPLSGAADACRRNGVYRHNAWESDTYGGVDPLAPITLIGTGLTAVDVLLRLREMGHRGVITAVSRHGVFPHRHKPHPTLPSPVIPSGTTPTCLAYIRALRSAILNGVDWRSAVDSLRTSTNELWLALPLTEQRRFRRHLQRRWDVVRHRMAPTIADVIDAERDNGTLQVVHGCFISLDARSDGLAMVTISSRGRLRRFATARVINCTGPNMNYRKAGVPLLSSLFARGAITAGPLGDGLRCDHKGAVIDSDNRSSAILFAIGPARLGTLLESIAVPELRQQAVELAGTLKSRLATPALAGEFIR
jgi:hydroxyacylglutathione hydrolase